MKFRSAVVILSVAAGPWATTTLAASLSPDDAPAHVGAQATVCGVVASAKYAARSRTQPTLLDMGQPYPNETFTAVIFGSDRTKFGEPETALLGKRVCVTGKVQNYQGKPEMILTDPSQIASE